MIDNSHDLQCLRSTGPLQQSTSSRTTICSSNTGTNAQIGVRKETGRKFIKRKAFSGRKRSVCRHTCMDTHICISGTGPWKGFFETYPQGVEGGLLNALPTFLVKNSHNKRLRHTSRFKYLEQHKSKKERQDNEFQAQDIHSTYRLHRTLLDNVSSSLKSDLLTLSRPMTSYLVCTCTHYAISRWRVISQKIILSVQ